MRVRIEALLIDRERVHAILEKVVSQFVIEPGFFPSEGGWGILMKRDAGRAFANPEILLKVNPALVWSYDFRWTVDVSSINECFSTNGGANDKRRVTVTCTLADLADNLLWALEAVWRALEPKE